MFNTPSDYTSDFARTEAVIGDSSFLCHVRDLTDAYAGKTYNLQYSFTPGIHALDLLPTFYNLNLNLSTLNDTAIHPYPLIPLLGLFALLPILPRLARPYWQPDILGSEISTIFLF